MSECQNYVRVDNRDIRCVGELGHRGECDPYANPDPQPVVAARPFSDVSNGFIAFWIGAGVLIAALCFWSCSTLDKQWEQKDKDHAAAVERDLVETMSPHDRLWYYIHQNEERTIKAVGERNWCRRVL